MPEDVDETAGKTLPQVAYEAFAAYQNWRSPAGIRISPWDRIPQDLQDAWGAAVTAICMALIWPMPETER